MSKELSLPVVSGIPADFHPDVIAGDNPAARIARTGLAAIYENTSQIFDVEKQIKNKIELAKAARPIFNKTQSRVKDYLGQLNLQHEKASKELEVNLTTGRNDPQAREIREYLRSNKTNFTELQNFVKSGNRPVVAAILGAPAFLSGLSEEHHNLLRTYAAKTLEPDLDAHIKSAEAGLAKLMRADAWLSETTTKKLSAWENGDDAHLAKLKPKTEAA